MKTTLPMSLWLFYIICLGHLNEHITQAVQAYALGWPANRSLGFLGLFWPFLVHSEILHYCFALFIMLGLFVFRDRFTGKAHTWWVVAFWIAFWHHIEHLLLLTQWLEGANLFHAPQPISVMQLMGFFHGRPETGFGGLLTMSHFGVCTCKGAAPGTVHKFSLLLVFVRRIEVHLIYNTIVTIPMVVAMILQGSKN